MDDAKKSRARHIVCYIIIAVVAIIAAGVVTAIMGSLSDNRDTASANSAVVTTIDSLHPAYSLVEMVEHSQTVVIGEVTGTSEPFMVKDVLGGDPRYFTDYYFRVDEVLYGDQSRAGTTIAVRVLGGGDAVFGVVSGDSPNLAVGGEHVFFLLQQGDGLNYNTAGDHFYILTGQQGSHAASDVDYIEQVQAAIANVSRETPLNADEARQINLDNLNSRYQSGEISEAEYNLYLQAFEQFAQVLTPDEVAAYEARILEQMQQNDAN